MDLISRQDVIDVLKSVSFIGFANIEDAMNLVNEILPAQQKGKWIDRSDGGRILYPWDESHECSQCGHNGSGAWEYCPRCGARMVTDEET